MELNAESNRSVEGLQLRLELFVNFSWFYKVVSSLNCLSTMVVKAGNSHRRLGLLSLAISVDRGSPVRCELNSSK